MLLAAADGHPVSRIAETWRTSESSVNAVIRQFQRSGFDSLRYPPEPSSRPRAPGRGVRRRSARLAAALVGGLVLLVAVALQMAGGGFDLEAREVSAEVGIHEVTHTWGATVVDFDGDGREDVLIAPHKKASPPPRLYHNVGGRFERVPAGRLPAVKKDRHDCDWGDVNQDGRLDLYCSVGGGKGTKRNSNDLWLQRRDGSFVDRAGAYGVRDLNGRGRDVAFMDANGDGFVDLFVANGYPRRDGRISENKLFLNVRGERFREAREYGLNRQLGGSEVQAVDYDGDGWTDLLVCAQDDRLHLYQNQRGRRFEDVSSRAGVEGNCRSAVLANLDGDRRLDLIRVSRARLVVKHQGADGRFTRSYQRRLQNGGDVAVGNVDGDRKDDLYVLQRGPPADDRDDLMLLNERDGRSFREVGIPQTKEGKAEAVVAIDHNGDGRSGFIVLNGKNEARGPIRLIAFR